MDPNVIDPKVSHIVVSELLETTVGTGIETIQHVPHERTQSFAVPISLKVAEKLAGYALGPMRRSVRAFSSSNSLIGEWAWNEALARDIAAKQLGKKGEKAEKKTLSPEEKQAKKLAKKLKSREQEREQLAKAPKALFPTLDPSIRYFDKMAGRDFSTMRLAAVPFIKSESCVGIWLTDRDGHQECIPIHEGLYKSAVSRGKAAQKENPEVDPKKYVKRLVAEVLLESGSGNSETINGKRVYTGSNQRWIKAAINCTKEGHEPLELNRDEAIKVQKKLAREEYKRKIRIACKKNATPFGKNGLSWEGRAKNTRAEFSRG